MQIYDYIIIGSGFGGSVSAMRLTEKGYSVLVLEKGKRFEDKDFAKTNWQFWKYLWIPKLRAHGILQITITKGAMILHGVGVGGGSLGYANVLEVPTDETFETAAWNTPLPWKQTLAPHYTSAHKMLNPARNPKLWQGDLILKQMAEDMNMGHTFRATDVGAYFGEAGVTVPDPFFNGEGPERAGCIHCGGCMVGCRYNAKNTLPKNYLYFAEKNGAKIKAEVEVTDVRPITENEGARYEISYQDSTKIFKRKQKVYAKNVIFSAGVMGTMNLLLNLRETSLPNISPKLGTMVRTNSEGIMGSIAYKSDLDYSQGVAISSIFNVDDVTRVEPVRYPDGSSLMRFVSAPLIDLEGGVPMRILNTVWWALRYPMDFLKSMILPGWAHNTTILLIMQHADNRMRFKLGRSLFTLFKRGLVAEEESGYEIKANVEGSHELTRDFAKRTNGIPMGSLGENLLNLPTTAHILGGAPMGKNADDSVVNENFELHNYSGLYIIDGSIMPANPGVNPSLTITALAEYAVSKIKSD